MVLIHCSLPLAFYGASCLMHSDFSRRKKMTYALFVCQTNLILGVERADFLVSTRDRAEFANLFRKIPGPITRSIP